MGMPEPRPRLDPKKARLLLKVLFVLVLIRALFAIFGGNAAPPTFQ